MNTDEPSVQFDRPLEGAEDWKAYRLANFLRCHEVPAYVWSGNHEFDFCTVAESLMTASGGRIDYDRHVFVLRMFDASYFIPFAQMSESSLQRLELRFAEPLVAHRRELLANQCAAEEKLLTALVERFVGPLTAEGSHAQQLH